MESKRHPIAHVTLMLALAAISLAIFNFSHAPETAHAGEDEADDADALCRYGVATNGDEVDWVSTFNAGWFLTFTRAAVAPDNGAQFVPVIHLSQPKDEQGNYLDGYNSNPRVDITDPSNPDSLRYWLEQQPGSLWIVGNEVDRPPDPGEIESPQDDVQPEQYAEAYHEIYNYIKQYDPEARVAISGLVQVTPSRLLYLDRFWEAYIQRYGHVPNIDVWTMHLYILSEVEPGNQSNAIAGLAVGTHDRPELGKLQSYDPDGIGPLTPADLCHDPYDRIYCWAETDNMDIFRQQVQDMRVWMKEHGQQEKPLLLTEYSLLPAYIEEGGGCYLADEFGNCFTPQRVQNFMQATFDYMENATDPNLGYSQDGHRLVQQWLWFSVNNSPYLTGQSSNLVKDDLSGLTAVGQHYQNVTAAKTAENNLVGLYAHPAVAYTNGGITATASIAASFLNNGNVHVTRPVSVTFYSNAGLTDAIGTATVTPGQGVLGCAQREYTAGVLWDGLAPGIHDFWAKVHVDAPDFTETNPGDNVVHGTVLVDPQHSLLLPVVGR